MRNMGYAHMGVGRTSGKDKARVAATMAIKSPLLETKIDGAKGIILNIIASADIDLNDVELAANMFKEAADSEANIIWGVAFSDDMDDTMSITAIATGFDEMLDTKPAPQSPLVEKKEEPVRQEPVQKPVVSEPAPVEPPKAEEKPAEKAPEAPKTDENAWNIDEFTDFDAFIKLLQKRNTSDSDNEE